MMQQVQQVPHPSHYVVGKVYSITPEDGRASNNRVVFTDEFCTMFRHLGFLQADDHVVVIETRPWECHLVRSADHQTIIFACWRLKVKVITSDGRVGWMIPAHFPWERGCQPELPLLTAPWTMVEKLKPL